MLRLTALICSLALAGCSVYKAATQPPPADLDGLGIGSLRAEIIIRLGAPEFSDAAPDGSKQDAYEFDSGLHSASKARVIPYLAADVFTLGLAELILWPMEMTVMEKAKCTAIVTYDADQKVKTWRVVQKDGVQDC